MRTARLICVAASIFLNLSNCGYASQKRVIVEVALDQADEARHGISLDAVLSGWESAGSPVVGRSSTAPSSSPAGAMVAGYRGSRRSEKVSRAMAPRCADGDLAQAVLGRRRGFGRFCVWELPQISSSPVYSWEDI